MSTFLLGEVDDEGCAERVDEGAVHTLSRLLLASTDGAVDDDGVCT